MADNFHQAVRQMITDALLCPHCQSANRPGCANIELTPDALAICHVCARSWPVDLRIQPT